MGIQGLLPLLKSIQRPIELKKYAGETLGVDAYGWLHRGAISCAVELAQGKPTRKYVDFAMHRVRMAKYFGVTPYLVFDGDFLPSKAGTEASRAKRREESRKAGLELLKAGKPSQAYLDLQKAIDVTPEMARRLIEELKAAGIPYVVAPYEADAQMIYLERQGIISGIISEDSDLLVFGAKRLLTKLDTHGQCVEINRRDFCAVREVSLTGWTDAEFRRMAILSGCDYLEGVNNLGLKTAYRMIRKYKTPERVIRMLQFDGKYKVSENYLDAFRQAELTFLYQRVFCPNKKELVLLTEPDPSIDADSMPFIGAPVEAELARAIACGDVNPITKEAIVMPQLPEKRRNSQISAPPALPQNRQPDNPIESYFKGHQRIPLGEMDRNCFKIEPERVRTLTENGQLPRVFPLPRPYIDELEGGSGTASRAARRRTEPVSRIFEDRDTHASSQSRRRTEGSAVLRTHNSGASGPGPSARPFKKARLCEDAPSQPEERTEKSRFFPQTIPKPPRKGAAGAPSSQTVEKALLSLPDVDGWRTTGSKDGDKLEIFEEKKEHEPRDKGSTAQDDTVVLNSDIEVPMSSPEEKVEREVVPESPRPEARLSETVRQFAYTPGVPKGPQNPTRMAHGLPTPASSIQSSTSSRTRTLLEASGHRIGTPLQRLGNQALHRSKSSITSPLTPRKPNREKEHRRQSYDSFPVNPSFVPLPKVELSEVEALNRPCGSEDQIIPDSDGENDEVEADEGTKNTGPRPTSRLNLSRFMFT